MKPLVLAHRGASAYAPENTMAAFDLALKMGADGVELDVTLTLDRIPVVIHDDNVDRTTNGHGPISAMTLEQVKALDASPAFDKYRGERIPTLEQVLGDIGKRARVNIELKGRSVHDDGLEVEVACTIDKTGTADSVLISSFNPFALRRMAHLRPHLPRGLLYANDMPIYLRRAWLRPVARPTAMHPKYTLVTPAYMLWARQKGYRVNTWTVDEPSEMKRLADLGVDAIMSNKPDLLAETLGRR